LLGALRQLKPAPKVVTFGIHFSLHWLSRFAPFPPDGKENVGGGLSVKLPVKRVNEQWKIVAG